MKMKKEKEKGIKYAISERKEALKAVSLFIILCFTLNFLYFKLAGEQIIPRSFTASLVALFLRLLGLNAEANGTFVLTNGTSLDVIGECTGIFSIIVYCSVIFAYPTSLRNKTIGLIGIPILYALTLVRLISTALVGVFIPSMLDFFHTYLWQVFLIVFVVLLFLIWQDKVVEAGVEVK
ncbi:MAG: archaeosortase/exosortase family protein [Candidatus Methanospirareceae archaeon]